MDGERVISVDLAISISLAHMWTVQKSTFCNIIQSCMEHLPNELSVDDSTLAPQRRMHAL